MFRYLFLLILLATGMTAAAQTWGKVEPEQFLQRTCSFDTSANAVVLYHGCTISFEFTNGLFYVVYDVYKRIQLLNKEGFGEATVAIPYYSSSYHEASFEIKAQTLNLAANGAAMAIKADKKSIFDEVLNDNWLEKKIVFPDIREGSIIEYEYVYKVVNGFRFLHDWAFQENLPVVRSSVTLRCPEFLQYKAIYEGDVNLSETKTDVFNDIYPPAFFGQRYRVLSTTVNGKISIYVVDTIPALKAESYITTMNDYRAKMNFVLSSTAFPSRPVKTYTERWDDVCDELMKSENFGLRLNGTGEHLKAAKELTEGVTDPVSKAKIIFYHLTGRMKWNDVYTYFPTRQRLAKSYMDSIGNSADINMILVDMLRAAGLKADPVLISTRKHGKVERAVPDLLQFNHVITVVTIDSQYLFLDAISHHRPYYLLGVNDLNSMGLRVSEDGSRWLRILPSSSSGYSLTGSIIFDSTTCIRAKMNLVGKDYEAINLRSELSEKRAAEIIKNKLKIADEVTVTEAEVENEKDVEKKLKISFTLQGQKPEETNNLIYLSPFMARFYADNPFKMAKRTYPVDFGYPFEEDIKLSIVLPPNYKVSELPKSLHVKLDDGSADFVFLINAEQQNIQINSSLKILKAGYKPEVYEGLKDLFANVIDAYSSVIVLQKDN